MSGRFIPDIVEGAQADFYAANGRIVRMGKVVNIDATATSDSGVLLGALTATDMPILGKDVYPGTVLVFVRMLIRGFTTDGVLVALYYETFQGLIPSAYIIRDRSSMASATMTYDPLTKELLTVSYDGTANIVGGGGSFDTGSLGGSQSDIQDIPALDNILCPTDVLMPCREISVTRISAGHPNVKGRDFFGSVNDNDWPGEPGSPFIGSGGMGAGIWTSPAPVGNPLKKGFWLLNRCETEWTRFLNYFTSDVSALSFVWHDWSQILTARDPSTGLFIKPRKGKLKALLDKDYAQGIDRGDGNNGIARWGPYPMCDYNADVFGF